MIDHYTVLGVARDASETEIRSAYGRAALQLEESKGPTPAGGRLREAFTTLVDPETRAAYDTRLATATLMSTAQNETGDAAYRYARTGAIWFAGGCLVTAATYLAAGDGGGRFFIAWGAVLFGGVQLVRGLASYLGSGAVRTQAQMLTLAGLVLLGVASGGWVVADQLSVGGDAATITDWNDALDAAQSFTDQADTLMDQVSNRTGWSAQDAIDLTQISSLYGKAADRLAAAPIIAGHEWYRDGLVADFREAAAVSGEMAKVGDTATQAQVSALGDRWQAWIDDYNSLTDRFDAVRRK